MNTTRAFRLSNSLLAELAAVDKNRSQAVTSALKLVNNDPTIIINQLVWRLSHPTVELEQTRVSVYLPVFVAAMFDEMVAKLRLPAEDVCRIALEAFVRSSTSHKASHESPRRLQHASEG